MHSDFDDDAVYDFGGGGAKIATRAHAHAAPRARRPQPVVAQPVLHLQVRNALSRLLVTHAAHVGANLRFTVNMLSYTRSVVALLVDELVTQVALCPVWNCVANT